MFGAFRILHQYRVLLVCRITKFSTTREHTQTKPDSTSFLYIRVTLASEGAHLKLTCLRNSVRNSLNEVFVLRPAVCALCSELPECNAFSNS